MKYLFLGIDVCIINQSIIAEFEGRGLDEIFWKFSYTNQPLLY